MLNFINCIYNWFTKSKVRNSPDNFNGNYANGSHCILIFLIYFHLTKIDQKLSFTFYETFWSLFACKLRLHCWRRRFSLNELVRVKGKSNATKHEFPHTHTVFNCNEDVRCGNNGNSNATEILKLKCLPRPLVHKTASVRLPLIDMINDDEKEQARRKHKVVPQVWRTTNIYMEKTSKLHYLYRFAKV